MFLSFKQRKYSTVQKWHVSRGFLENPHRPVFTDRTEPSRAPESLRSRVEIWSEPSSKDLTSGRQTAPKDLAGVPKSSHEFIGKGRVK